MKFSSLVLHGFAVVLATVTIAAFTTPSKELSFPKLKIMRKTANLQRALILDRKVAK